MAAPTPPSSSGSSSAHDFGFPPEDGRDKEDHVSNTGESTTPQSPAGHTEEAAAAHARGHGAGGSNIGGIPVAQSVVNLWGSVQTLHRQVESLGFRKKVMGGIEPTCDNWANYLLSLKAVYQTIEERLAELPVFSDPTISGSMQRTAAFEAALAAYPLDERGESGVATEYAGYLRDRCAPEMVEIHVFTRYLALMFGGQMMAKKLAAVREETWGLSREEGADFYNFGDSPRDVMRRYLTDFSIWYDAKVQEDPDFEERAQAELKRAFVFAGRMLDVYGDEADHDIMAEIEEVYRDLWS